MRSFTLPTALLLVTAVAVGCKEDVSEPDLESPPAPEVRWDVVGQISHGYPGAPEIHPGLIEAIQAAPRGDGGKKRPPRMRNLSLVGSLNVGISSDVWAHRNFAYVGGLGSFFPVRIIDISDPRHPQLVTELPNPPDGNSPQDVKVATIQTRFFHGDLLVVGNDFGGPPPFGGIELWDVSNPSSPTLLSRPRVGPVHNTFLYQKGHRAFVLLAEPFAEVFAATFPPFVPFGDLAILEVTDPRHPKIIADWGAGKDGGLAFGSPFFAGDPSLPPGSDCTPPPGTPELCRGDSAAVFLHDVWVSPDGNIAYLSYWDAGLITLDISNPANPTLIGHGVEPPTFGSDEGNLHVAVPALRGNLVVVGDEDFSPLPWGFLRVFATHNPANPFQIGAFATRGSLTDDDPDFVRTMHNIHVRGNKAFLSWYHEGIRVLDISRPFHPREIAAFTAAGAPDEGFFWGVYFHDNLILGSDILTGLFVLRLD